MTPNELDKKVMQKMATVTRQRSLLSALFFHLQNDDDKKEMIRYIDDNVNLTAGDLEKKAVEILYHKKIT